jgi:hypothetical protein
VTTTAAWIIVAVLAVLAIGAYVLSKARRRAAEPAVTDIATAVLEAATAFSNHDLGSPRFDEAFRGLALDFSVESLKRVDEGLERLRQDLPESHDGEKDLSSVNERALFRLIASAGSYVGEVIRRGSGDGFQWVAHADLPADAMAVFGGQQDASNFAVLHDRLGGSFSLPMNRIGRFLTNGPEDSTHGFAIAIMRSEG